jgi:tetratricopeptide (TPR) repeat protein
MFRQSLAVSLLLAAANVFAAATAASFDAAIADVGHRWAAANYQTPDAQKDAAFGQVIATAQQVAKAFPDRAEPLVWEAIALSGAAGVEGGLSALHKAKQARDLLLAAAAIDPRAMDGSIYCTLGSLYAKVPGWPIGFGDKKQARSYLDKALALDPAGIDANYFYADFLADQGDYARSAQLLQRALAAPARPGREDADAGRRKDAQELLASLKQKHGDAIASN